MSELKKMKRDEILILDQKLRRCAQLVMEPYLNLEINIRNDQEDESQTLCDLLKNIVDYQQAFSTYYKVRFRDRAKEDLKLRTEIIGDNINDLFILLKEDELSRPEMGILFPISIYVLIINNCFNKYAIERENQRIKEAVKKHNKKARSENTKEISYEDMVRNMFKFSNRKLCSITRTISEEKYDELGTYDKNIFALAVVLKKLHRKNLKESTKAIAIQSLWDYPEINLAKHLALNRKELIYYGESAQAGILLKSVLLINAKIDKPLDRILRLYIANEIDQILMRTGVMNGLTADVFLDMETNNGIVKWYCEQIGLLQREDRVGNFREYLSQWQVCLDEIKKLKESGEANQCVICEYCEDDKSDTRNESFDCLYEDLDRNCPFSKKDADDILEFYLNKEVLGKKGDLRHTAMQYIYRLASYFTGRGKRYLKELSGSDYVYHRNIANACIFANNMKEVKNLKESLIDPNINRDKVTDITG